MVRTVEFHVCGVVAPDRLAPGFVGVKQALAEFCCIVGIRDRIEGCIQIGEGIRVVAQINLHAADIDVANTLGLQFLNMGDGCAFGGKVLPIRPVRYGPWLGK